MHLNSSLRTESAEAFQGETETDVFFSTPLPGDVFVANDQKKEAAKIGDHRGG